MAHGQPDFWTVTIPSMPVAGEGQVPWYQSDKASVAATGSEDLINYVVPDEYELHVCSGVVSCEFPCLQRYDLRTTPAATWVSPTSHSDPDNVWTNEENAYDGNLATFAYTGMPANDWSSYLHLLVNQTYIDKIRFYVAVNPGLMDKIDVDVYYDGAWHDVYEGAFSSGEWVSKDVPAGASLISKARVRFHNALAIVVQCALYEFQFNTSGAAPQEGIYFDTHAIIPYLPQAPYVVEPKATFAVRVYNDDGDAHTMSAALAGFLQKRT